MGIKTEKTLALLGFISVIFIIFTTTLMQLSHKCLITHENKIQLKMLEIDEMHGLSIFYQNEHTRNSLIRS